ncbi:MAG: hypothetical protein IJ736_03565 [Firmicutes bacterium]|nr:hypothetical protein [Bacillota bacterium]
MSAPYFTASLASSGSGFSERKMSLIPCSFSFARSGCAVGFLLSYG